MIKNKFFQDVQAAYSQNADKETLTELLGKGRSRKGMFEGDVNEGELEIGQAAAMLREILPAGEIVKRMIGEYSGARERLKL